MIENLKDNFRGTSWVIVALVILLIASIAFIPWAFHAESTCLELGYPHTDILIDGSIMCGRTVNQTEYVCSIEDITDGNCIPDAELY